MWSAWIAPKMVIAFCSSSSLSAHGPVSHHSWHAHHDPACMHLVEHLTRGELVRVGDEGL